MEEKALVPKQFMTAPIFASQPQKESRELEVFGKKWTIGAPDPLEQKKKPKPALDIRHGKLIFLMLSKFNFIDEKANTINFSIYELAEQYFGVYGGAQHRKIKELLKDLRDTFVRIQEKENESVSFTVIKGANYREKYRKKDRNQPELWLENIQLSEIFIKTLVDWSNLMHIQLNEIFRMKTPLAAAIYTYIPSRAMERKKEAPFEITLTVLLEQLGEKIPEKKALRKQKFLRKDSRYDIDVVSDLDKAILNSGKILRCIMTETVDDKDYKLQLWVERPEKLPPSGALWEAWSYSGGTIEEWNEHMSRLYLIRWNPYEEDAFSEFDNWEESETFFRMAKSLLGDLHFTEILGEVKNCIREGRDINGKPILNPGAYLNDMLCRGIQNRNGENKGNNE